MSRPNHPVIAVHIIMNIQSITLLNQDNWLKTLSVFQHFSELVSAVAHRWRCRSINSPSSNKIRRFKISQHCPNNSNTTQFDKQKRLIFGSSASPTLIEVLEGAGKLHCPRWRTKCTRTAPKLATTFHFHYNSHISLQFSQYFTNQVIVN